MPGWLATPGFGVTQDMMRPERETEAETREFSLDGGCLLCGGDLMVRVGPEGAATFCPTCRWISHPAVHRGEEGLLLSHPPALAA